MILRYVASSGRVYDLNTTGKLVKSANFHSWAWAPIGTGLQYGVRVSDFRRDPLVYSMTVVCYGSYTARKAFFDALHDDFEADVRNQTTGRIIWGDYYVDCYITKSDTAPGNFITRTENSFEIYCPYPFWIKEDKKSFYPQEAPAGQTFLDYPFDYDYDFYFGSPGIAIWQTDFPFTSMFEMTFYGECANPRVIINGHPYQVNTDLSATEYLTIDSRENTVTKFLSTGQAVNAFDLRDKVNSVFEPIAGGNIQINWSGLFGFDITLFEERSEPRWSL